MNPLIICHRRVAAPHLRLYCFPCASGRVSVFRSWPSGLPPEVEIFAVQLPGRENPTLKPPFRQIEPLVNMLVECIDFPPDLPFAFFGHSFGSLVSFECARALRRQGLPGPVHLFVSGYWAPQLPYPGPRIHQLPERLLVEQLRQLNGTPDEVLREPDLLELVLPGVRADLAICETYAYNPEPPLGIPISAFGGTQDHWVSRENLAAWQEQTSCAFKLRMFPGGHFFINTARSLLLQALSLDMAPLLKRESAPA